MEHGSLTHSAIADKVFQCARALRNAGVGSGDAVAGYMANVPETIIAALATSALGAVWASASPDFGIGALADRFGQVQPRIVFASTHYCYGGRAYSTAQTVGQLKQRVSSIETIVSVPYPTGTGEIVGDVDWDAFLCPHGKSELDFPHLPFDHPLYILFSSGTTGKPKCLVHGQGGTLLQHTKELALHCDLKEDDRLLFFTTCGWMMWNWMVSALSLGVTLCLYDGNPGYPDLSAIWHHVHDFDITHFGTSGRFIESCMKGDPAIPPGSFGPLPNLRSVMYTGSPLSKSGYRWVYDTIKQDVQLAGISGGTDIVSCFVLGNPNLPVHAGEIQCKGLGIDVAAFDRDRNEVWDTAGELVCRKPIPSMPVYFLDDEDGSKYEAAYFETFPGVWCHGDFVEFRSTTGGVVIYGRSDATLNPGGVRIGSAEIYSALDGLAEVGGAVVVGWTPPGQADEVIVLFVVPRTGILDGETISRIRETIRRKCSPRHVPRHVLPISGVPVTRSGKPVELSVKAILAGREIANRSALANPEVLREFEDAREELLRLHAGT